MPSSFQFCLGFIGNMWAIWSNIDCVVSCCSFRPLVYRSLWESTARSNCGYDSLPYCRMVAFLVTFAWVQHDNDCTVGLRFFVCPCCLFTKRWFVLFCDHLYNLLLGSSYFNGTSPPTTEKVVSWTFWYGLIYSMLNANLYCSAHVWPFIQASVANLPTNVQINGLCHSVNFSGSFTDQCSMWSIPGLETNWFMASYPPRIHTDLAME